MNFDISYVIDFFLALALIVVPCALWSLFQWALALIVVPCVLWSLFIAVLTAFNLEVVDCVPEGELKDTLISIVLHDLDIIHPW